MQQSGEPNVSDREQNLDKSVSVFAELSEHRSEEDSSEVASSEDKYEVRLMIRDRSHPGVVLKSIWELGAKH